MSALEKAARAAGQADGFDWDEFRPDPTLREEIRDEYRAQARAVLMAVRDCEDPVRHAVARAAWHSGSGQTATNVWRAGIDAILSEGDPK